MFLDLLGFGMLIPDVQFRAEALGARGWLIGALLASTFVVQFFVSPWWGSASDRFGRKPVLLACSALSATAMIVYGFGHSLWIILGSRLLSGLGSANVSVAQAWIADTSSGSQRAATMGRIGAAISAGLIAGPALGGVVAHTGGSWAVGVSAGSCSAIGVLIIAAFLPKAPPVEKLQTGKRVLFNFTLVRDLPRVRALAIVAIVAWFSLAMLEGTFGRLIERTLGFGQREFGLIFGFESVCGLVIQGGLIGYAVSKLGEANLLRAAFVVQGLGLALTPLAPSFAALIGASALYAIGSGLANPTINSLCSKLTPDDRQGELFGLLQGTRAIGFVVGPSLGGALFDVRPWAPYAVAGIVCVVAAAGVRPRMGNAPDS